MKVYSKRSIRSGFVVECSERDLDSNTSDVLTDNNLFREPIESEEVVDRVVHELNALSQQSEV